MNNTSLLKKINVIPPIYGYLLKKINVIPLYMDIY